jgi:hypothetical protein
MHYPLEELQMQTKKDLNNSLYTSTQQENLLHF